ncbi:MAG: LytR C-terminal domain-containing protein [Mycobacterium sp.]
MNERVPDSNGLPLRAMVMVLLFLGVVFLLLGLQAAEGSSGDDETSSSAATTSTSTSAPSSAAAESSDDTPSPEPPATPEVHVLNNSSVAGVAQSASTQLTDNGVDVASTGDLDPAIAPDTGVFYPEGDESRMLAEQVGEIIGLPVAVRGDNLADQPPGIIVVVTG